jgi:hypothetical protein
MNLKWFGRCQVWRNWVLLWGAEERHENCLDGWWPRPDANPARQRYATQVMVGEGAPKPLVCQSEGPPASPLRHLTGRCAQFRLLPRDAASLNKCFPLWRKNLYKAWSGKTSVCLPSGDVTCCFIKLMRRELYELSTAICDREGMLLVPLISRDSLQVRTNIFSEEHILLGCNTVKYGENTTFRKNISPPSSGSKRKLNSVFRLFLLVSCLAYSSVLTMGMTCSSETSGCLRKTPRWNP